MTREFTHARRLAGTVLSLSALSLLITGTALLAGPITPPPGPVAPTPGPEPRIAINATNTPGDANSSFRIAAPGSYYLAGNLTGVSGKRGIELAADNVTIDLNGFTLAGVSGSLDGIVIDTPTSGRSAITVRSGVVTGWGGEGVDLNLADGCRVEDVSATLNSSGIVVSDNAIVRSCVATQNTLAGFISNTGCVFDGCAASLNGTHGFSVNAANVVTHCTAWNNVQSGISCGTDCSVMYCVSWANVLHGITFQRSGYIAWNTCNDNGPEGDGAGIFTSATNSRIESNSCISNERGIDVDVGGNIIVRNTCTDNNTNWDVAANNRCLVVSAVAAPAILGNSGGASLGSTDPNANYTY